MCPCTRRSCMPRQALPLRLQFCCYLKNRKTFHGELALVWVMLYSGFRLFEELFRGGVRGDLVFNRYPASQVMALVLLIVAAALFPVLKKRNRCL